MKKFITLTLALIMVLGCFAGCSGDSYKEDTVMVVNGTEVSFDEYCYWLGYSASYLQYVYSSYTGSSAVDWDAPSTRIRPTSSGALQTPRRPSSKAA